jgi:amidophosphoribosyltransferase
LVCGVPDSGTAHAVGYANASGIPYKRALIKYTAGWSRSYMPPKQERRDEIAHFKLIPIASLIKDKEIILVDDSIRRGTQLRRLLEKKIWPLGPKKVHIRVASPPQLYPCIKDKADASRLAARRAIFEIEGKEIEDYSEYMDETSEKYKQMVEGIRKEIGATTLAFISLSDMAAATKVPKENLCLHCWTGKF